MLTGAPNFSNATLDYVQFDRNNLRDAVFDDATLRNIQVEGDSWEPPGMMFHRTRFEGLRLSNLTVLGDFAGAIGIDTIAVGGCLGVSELVRLGAKRL